MIQYEIMYILSNVQAGEHDKLHIQVSQAKIKGRSDAGSNPRGRARENRVALEHAPGEVIIQNEGR